MRRYSSMSSFGSTTAATPACSSPIRYDAQPRSSWVIWRKIMRDRTSRLAALQLGLQVVRGADDVVRVRGGAGLDDGGAAVAGDGDARLRKDDAGDALVGGQGSRGI